MKTVADTYALIKNFNQGNYKSLKQKASLDDC